MAVTALLTTAVLGTASSSSAATKTTKKKAATKATKKAVARGIMQPNGRPPNPAVPFFWEPCAEQPCVKSFEEATTKIVPNNQLFTILVIGSDARAKENPERTRADSIHLIVWNPAFNKGIIIGIPRDAYVDIPGRGKGKINSALSVGGPTLLLATVNNMTRNPRLRANRYVVSGFAGFINMINDIGGVNVLVDPAMNDVASGARFSKGWFAMNGNAALAFNRNRKSVAGGDFGRSANHGKFILYTMAKLRAEVSDTAGLLRWINTFRKNGRTNIPIGDMMVLSQMVRMIDPVNMQNVVLTGKTVKVGKPATDAVQLDAAGLPGFWQDVANDAVNDGK